MVHFFFVFFLPFPHTTEKAGKKLSNVKMYNFNQTSLSTPPMLGVGMDFCSGTPRTPEILNSLIAMTNPFEYSYASSLASQQSHVIPMSMSMSPLLDTSPVIECKMENSYLQFDNNSQSNCSSSSSLESPSTTPFHMSSSMLSNITTTTSSTPSIQQVRNLLFYHFFTLEVGRE